MEIIAVRLFIILVCVLSCYMMFAPRTVWWMLRAWRYRDPAANEPSDIAFFLQRLGGAVILVIMIGGFASTFVDN